MQATEHIAIDLPLLLIVDDDDALREVLTHALQKRGFTVQTAADVPSAIALAEHSTPEYALVDLKMPGESGLMLIHKLLQLDPATRIVVLTGYASIATAVEAIKLGAIQYLSKPAGVAEILAALQQTEANPDFPVTDATLSVNRLEWEHIQRVLHENNGNISATARALNMHRRTLQRKLFKNPAAK